MSKNMILTGNQAPGDEMPGTSMNGEPISPKGGEMPTGNMTDIQDDLDGQMPPDMGEMPMGTMNDTAENYSEQMSPIINDMSMGHTMNNPSNAFFNSQNLHSEGDMPKLGMNSTTTTKTTEQEAIKTITIPGNWKLQLTHSS